MVIDTSVIAAILFGENDAARLAATIENDPVRLLSAGSALEASIVIESELGEPGGRELDLLIFKTGTEIVPFTNDQFDIARYAYRSFGKGRHPAGLNYGDCFSYALSKTSGEPLLFKGNDFAQTDVLRCDLSP